MPHYEQDKFHCYVQMCVEYGWGKHLTYSLWVNKCCRFCALFTFFLEVSPLKVCRNYLGNKSTSKPAKKLTPSQFCTKSLKLVSTIFHQMITAQKLWKMFFILSKTLFSFARYSDFCFSDFPSFSSCQPLLKRLFEDKF